MDCGTYCCLFLREMFGNEPLECIEATPTLLPEPWDQKCDKGMQAKWRFPNGGIGSVECTLSNPMLKFKLPWCQAVHKEKVVYDEELSEEKRTCGGQESCGEYADTAGGMEPDRHC